MSSIDQEMVLAHFIVSDDVERSRRFYTEVLGGKTVISGEGNDEVTYVALANSWIIINVGGGPTDDKPTVTLETPARPRSGEQLPQHPGRGHPSGVRRVERAGRPIPDAAEAARDRDALLHPRSRRLPDRGGSNDPGQRLASTVLIPRKMCGCRPQRSEEPEPGPQIPHVDDHPHGSGSPRWLAQRVGG